MGDVDRGLVCSMCGLCILLKLGGYGLLRVFPVLFKIGFMFGVVWVSLSLDGGFLFVLYTAD